MAKKRKITFIRVFLGAISLFVGVVIIGLLINMLSNPIEKELIKLWGESNHFFYLICILGIALILLLLTYLLENAEPKEVAPPPDLRTEFLKNLKQLYSDRLRAKMTGELQFEIKLNLRYTTRGTRPQTIDEQYIIKEEADAGDFDRLCHTYTDRLWRLLILGEPGAGKSILLLRLGLRLLERAERDPGFPIPVLLDLASWRYKKRTFDYWLEANLPYVGGSFAVSKEDAKQLVASQNLLLLLDGFDEIREEYRNPCFRKLLPWLDSVKNARPETYPEVIVCSRVLEYEAAEADAPVFASVMVQPLSPPDVDAALEPLIEKNFVTAKRLQAALKDSPPLYSALTSAFFVHTLLDLFEPAAPPRFQSDTPAALQREITEHYIAGELGKISAYPPEKAKKWLGWLAWKMKYLEGAVSFELSELQPWWTKRKYAYGLVLGLALGLILGLVIDLVFGLSIGLPVNLVNGLVLGLVGGLSFGLSFGLFKTRIYTIEIMMLDMNRLNWKIIRKNLIFSLVAGLVLGLVGGLAGGLAFGLAGGLIGGSAFSLVLGLVRDMSVYASFPKISDPYRRFLAPFWRDVWQLTFVAFITLGLGVYAAEHSYSGFLFGLVAGILASTTNSPIFRHACLRLALWLEKAIPRKLVTFLDAVSATGLLIKDGGKWRFRHQLIHDSLADWFEATHPEMLRKSDLEDREKKRAEAARPVEGAVE